MVIKGLKKKLKKPRKIKIKKPFPPPPPNEGSKNQ